MSSLFIQKKFAPLALVSLMLLVGSGCDMSGNYAGKEAESALALYGLVDIGAANEYLAPQGLEAVEVAPGKALSGITFIHWNQVKMGPMTLSNYDTTAIPLLVNRIDGQVRNAYFFGDWSTNSRRLRFISKQLNGMFMTKGFFEFELGSSFPETANSGALYSNGCTAEWQCGENLLHSSLKMGPSKKEELQVTQGVVLEIPSINPKTAKGQVAYDFKLSGTEYRRAFDPTRDSYWVAPGSVQGKLFANGHFVPTVWSAGRNYDIVTSNTRKIKD